MLQELAGWETEKMARRYAHFAASHLAVYADKLEISGTNTARHRISAAQRFQHVEKQDRRRGVRADTRIFRPRVACVCKLMILQRSIILHCALMQGRNRTTDTRIFNPFSAVLA